MTKTIRALGLLGLATWAVACGGTVKQGGNCSDAAVCGPSTSAGAAPMAGQAGGDAGGDSAIAGGGAPPMTSRGVVDKIDLLFMIDNSASMQDKQNLLSDAVPPLVARLVNPICVKSDGTPSGATASSGVCPAGQGTPEFKPIGDIHIGVVSSSLGAHGGTVCATPTAAQDTLDDKGRLIPSMRTGVASWNNSGFLAWDASGNANSPPGERNPRDLITGFKNMLGSVGERGCGYEASLESWYRFLIDPEPPAEVKLVNGQTARSSRLSVNPDGSFGACEGCDQTLLAQRKAFLRPDSLVAIVMLSDANDCSIRDDSVGWFVGSSNRMPLSSAACATNPNDPCCRSCATREDTPRAGCVALTADANCKAIPSGTQYASWDALHDSLNLRCYKQQQRFGFDLLYATSRYVDALKKPTLELQSTGERVTNPLYDSAGTNSLPRHPSLVFLAGIVGVPWQDIADEASLNGPGLNYLTAKQLVEKNRWPLLLGVPEPIDGSAPVPPADPFMIESIEPRTGTNPIAQIAISPANSMNPHANVINGHEQNVPNLDDLQYACIFPLQTPKDCLPGDPYCQCSPDKMGISDAVIAANSPLCQGGENINQQTSAKAYPGVRELQVLKDLGENAIVASICPKVTVPAGSAELDPNYGYNPAIHALIERLKEAL
ncbi:MAG TPA: hypothetical protein VJV79_15195 [Polyangiaceae bacterium]|nr:hypothetical protein [Polyangiaceae bacterium]